MIHGHKKSQKNKPQSQVKQEKQLSEKINSKLGQFFAIRKQPIVQNKITALIQFTTILMQLCPDITTIFNYRRELIQKLTHGQQPADKAKTIGHQIKLITKIIQGDPKSYTLWSYRQWLVVKLFNIDPSIIKKQKQLCALLLTKDEKNFHVWNYRSWANSIQMNVDSQLQFTKSKINSNPFNFSPYHFRSKYLQQKYQQLYNSASSEDKKQIVTYGMTKQVYNTELQTIRTAIFLNPKQQAPWLYYSWLLKQILPSTILSIQARTNQCLIYDITSNIKIENFSQILQIQGNPNFQLISDQTPSNKWQLKFSQKVQRNQIKFKTNIDQFYIKNQLSGRRVIADVTDQASVAVVKEILQNQEKFIMEVIESQENQCRFAYLQLLDIYRSFFFCLGITQLQWKSIAEKVLQCLDGLKNQTKGHKYIQKQNSQWQRIINRANLSELQQKIFKFRQA